MNRWIEHEDQLYNLDKYQRISFIDYGSSSEIFLHTENDHETINFRKEKIGKEFYEKIRSHLQLAIWE